jgi:hypothetical protein
LVAKSRSFLASGLSREGREEDTEDEEEEEDVEEEDWEESAEAGAVRCLFPSIEGAFCTWSLIGHTNGVVGGTDPFCRPLLL